LVCRRPLKLPMSLARFARLAAFLLTASLSFPALAGPSEGVEPQVRKGVVPITRVEPEFPREAIRAGVDFGQVVARVYIDEEGNVTGVSIKESHPKNVFDEEVIRALSQWKFKPEGEKMIAEIESIFELEGRSANANAVVAAKRAFAKGDYSQAEKLWRPAAEGGNSSAQASLGFMYETGRGVGKDEAEAAQWYRKAADKGSAFAQSSLGAMYANGRGGLAQDDRQAVEWFRKAAEKGDALAQANLGIMYANGRGGLPSSVLFHLRTQQCRQRGDNYCARSVS
jgi:TonB family protein